MNRPTSRIITTQPPGLAVIANCLTPYRIHLHELIAAGIPELKFHTLISHGDADFRWNLHVPGAINVTRFGGANDSPLAGVLHAPLREWRKGGRLIRYLDDNNIRAVICSSYRYLSYLRVIDHCHHVGVPLFVNNDSNIRSESPLSSLKAWTKRRVYAWWLKRSSGVMPFGNLGEQFFLKYGADAKRFYRLPCVPDYDAFAAPDLDRLQRFRNQYGLCGKRRYLLFSGRLAPIKRVDLLIDAFARLAGERPEWDLLIAGAGPLDEELRRRVPEPLRDRVVWTGFLEQPELKSAYHVADVLVLPSDHEPWAVVVLEALAAGLTVVASDVVAAAVEIVRDGVSGRIFEKGDMGSLFDALMDVTDARRIDEYQHQARLALIEYRTKIDPIQEIRRALTDVGVLTRRT